MSIELQARNLLRVSPYMIIFSGLFSFLITNEYIGLRFSFYVLVTAFLSLFLKCVANHVLPDRLKDRPINAGKCLGCDAYFDCKPKCKNYKEKMGMPSGHAMIFGMTAIFICLIIWSKEKERNGTKIIKIASILVFSFVVIISRTHLVENCHTFEQVIIGTMIGMSLGLVFYLFEEKYVLKI